MLSLGFAEYQRKATVRAATAVKKPATQQAAPHAKSVPLLQGVAGSSTIRPSRPQMQSGQRTASPHESVGAQAGQVAPPDHTMNPVLSPRATSPAAAFSAACMRQ